MNAGTHEPSVIEIHDVVKRFGKVIALSGVSLRVPRGSIVGLLGANGAGKTTLLRHVVGHALPDEGWCLTFGCQAEKLSSAELACIGMVHQEEQLVDWMSVRQCIEYVSVHYPTWNDELAGTLQRQFELAPDQRVGALSTGQRQRLTILLAIAFEPELLILDEPAAALDPLARAEFLDMLLDMIQDRNRTILISSHILSDVEKVIDRVVILDRGAVVRDCPFEDLQEEFCRVRLHRIDRPLPEESPFEQTLSWKGDGNEAVALVARPSTEDLAQVESSLGCRIEHSGLSLEELYRYVLKPGESR